MNAAPRCPLACRQRTDQPWCALLPVRSHPQPGHCRHALQTSPCPAPLALNPCQHVDGLGGCHGKPAENALVALGGCPRLPRRQQAPLRAHPFTACWPPCPRCLPAGGAILCSRGAEGLAQGCQQCGQAPRLLPAQSHCERLVRRPLLWPAQAVPTAQSEQQTHSQRHRQQCQQQGTLTHAKRLPAHPPTHPPTHRLQDDDNMKEALRYSAALLGELRTSLLR